MRETTRRQLRYLPTTPCAKVRGISRCVLNDAAAVVGVSKWDDNVAAQHHVGMTAAGDGHVEDGDVRTRRCRGNGALAEEKEEVELGGGDDGGRVDDGRGATSTTRVETSAETVIS